MLNLVTLQNDVTYAIRQLNQALETKATAKWLTVAAQRALESLERASAAILEEMVEQRRTWTDDGYWHKPSSAHPATCGGCTSDESRWGKPISGETS